MAQRLRVWLARAAGVVAARRRDARLDEEIQAHLEALAAGHEARGLAPDEARLAARRDFGGVEQVREAHRAQAGLPWLDAVARDLAMAVRRVRTEPWFSGAVVAALGIGIGGAVAVASAVTAIAWATPPFRDPGRVMALGTVDVEGRRADVSWPEFQVWRDGTRTFEALAASAVATFTVADPERAAVRVQGAYVTANTFTVLGRAPILGRDFVAADDRPGARPVVLLGAAQWTAAFGGAADVIGRTVVVDGTPAVVIGVMPVDVSFPLTGELWMPMTHRPGLATSGRDRRNTGVVGRLRPGVARAAALAEITAIADRDAATASPSAGVATRPTVAPFAERYLGRATDAVPLVLLGAAAMALVIGCATAATLLFARSTFRADEMAMRAALGGSPARLLQQLLVECAVYAALAAGLGLALTWLALRRFAVELSGAGMPPWVRFDVDPRVLTFAFAAFAFAVVAAGLAPAWRLAGGSAVTLPGGGRATAPRGAQRWIRVLLAGEVALTLVLLSGAADLVAAARTLARADQVLDPGAVVTARLGLGGAGYGEAAQRAALYQRYLERLQRRGELDAASLASVVPFGGTPMRQVALDGGAAAVSARHVAIDSGYLATLGLAAVRGRGFTANDGSPGRPAALVNARFAAQYSAAEEVLGRRLRVASSPTGAPDGEWLPIVGVLPSIRQGAAADAEPVVYVPLAADPPATVTVMARAAAGVPVADVLRDELRDLDREVPLYGWQTLARWSELSRWTQRTVGGIVAILGTLSLTLAALGIYAVTAYAAARRRKEAGIRMAVGATTADLLRLLVRGALWPAVAGLAAGAAGAVMLGRVLGSLVPQTGGGPGPAVAVTAVVAAVTAVAAVVPARAIARATSVASLRQD